MYAVSCLLALFVLLLPPSASVDSRVAYWQEKYVSYMYNNRGVMISKVMFCFIGLWLNLCISGDVVTLEWKSQMALD